MSTSLLKRFGFGSVSQSAKDARATTSEQSPHLSPATSPPVLARSAEQEAQGVPAGGARPTAPGREAEEAVVYSKPAFTQSAVTV